jgi:hypothetical protein
VRPDRAGQAETILEIVEKIISVIAMIITTVIARIRSRIRIPRDQRLALRRSADQSCSDPIQPILAGAVPDLKRRKSVNVQVGRDVFDRPTNAKIPWR